MTEYVTQRKKGNKAKIQENNGMVAWYEVQTRARQHHKKCHETKQGGMVQTMEKWHHIKCKARVIQHDMKCIDTKTTALCEHGDILCNNKSSE